MPPDDEQSRAGFEFRVKHGRNIKGTPRIDKTHILVKEPLVDAELCNGGMLRPISTYMNPIIGGDDSAYQNWRMFSLAESLNTV